MDSGSTVRPFAWIPVVTSPVDDQATTADTVRRAYLESSPPTAEVLRPPRRPPRRVGDDRRGHGGNGADPSPVAPAALRPRPQGEEPVPQSSQRGAWPFRGEKPYEAGIRPGATSCRRSTPTSSGPWQRRASEPVAQGDADGERRAAPHQRRGAASTSTTASPGDGRAPGDRGLYLGCAYAPCRMALSGWAERRLLRRYCGRQGARSSTSAASIRSLIRCAGPMARPTRAVCTHGGDGS
jgi:hypothetical protein